MDEARQMHARARELLSSALPQRWWHVCEVARRSTQVDAVREEGQVLECAAWAHDLGYAPALTLSGFHPLDGARYLRDTGTSERIAGLVAFHSSAAAEAELFGVANELTEFTDERTLTRDLLWYLDMTTGPDGQRLTFDERMAEVRERYSPEHYVIRALDLGMPERAAAVERASAWLSSVGLAHV